MLGRGSLRNTAIAFLCSAIVAGLLGACGHAPRPSVRYVFLQDKSESVWNAAFTDRCQAAFGQVAADAAATRGSLTVETVDQNPLVDSGTPVDVSFAPPASIADNPAYADPWLRALQSDAANKMAATLKSPPTASGTDLFDAMLLADRVFRRPASSSAAANTLVVCSDMLNVSAVANFNAFDFGSKADQALLEELAQDRLLPSWKDLNVRVLVVGGGTNTNGQTTASRLLEVQRFWTAYFRQVGTTLVGWNSTLPPGEGG